MQVLSRSRLFVSCQSTRGGFEEEDLLGLGQHDVVQGPNGLRGDVHGGLPVERRQHCVLDVEERPAGQLGTQSESHGQTTRIPTGRRPQRAFHTR